MHIYTQTIHRTTQHKQYIEQYKNFGTVRAVPHLCGFYSGICLPTEEKARQNPSQGSRRVPADTKKIHLLHLQYTAISFQLQILSLSAISSLVLFGHIMQTCNLPKEVWPRKHSSTKVNSKIRDRNNNRIGRQQ